MPKTIKLTVYPTRKGKFMGRVDPAEIGLPELRKSSPKGIPFAWNTYEPFLMAARHLLDYGCGEIDPDDTLVMYHAGSNTPSLRAKLRVAAQWTVDERTGCRFRKFKPFNLEGLLTVPGASKD
jgi:hypothetical protein